MGWVTKTVNYCIFKWVSFSIIILAGFNLQTVWWGRSKNLHVQFKEEAKTSTFRPVWRGAGWVWRWWSSASLWPGRRPSTPATRSPGTRTPARGSPGRSSATEYYKFKSLTDILKLEFYMRPCSLCANFKESFPAISSIPVSGVWILWSVKLWKHKQ